MRMPDPGSAVNLPQPLTPDPTKSRIRALLAHFVAIGIVSSKALDAEAVATRICSRGNGEGRRNG